MSELKPEELEHIAYMQTIEIQSLTARIAELEAENDRLQSSWFRDETICPDGSLRASVSDLLNRIAKLEAAQRWIPVSERLPENENDQVLIRRGNVVALGWIYFDELMGDWDYRCYDEDWSGHPTHWMPLPTPPEVQE